MKWIRVTTLQSEINHLKHLCGLPQTESRAAATERTVPVPAANMTSEIPTPPSGSPIKGDQYPGRIGKNSISLVRWLVEFDRFPIDLFIK